MSGARVICQLKFSPALGCKYVEKDYEAKHAALLNFIKNNKSFFLS
jgi:hypothetical protein